MKTSIVKNSKSIIVKILVGIIILPFLFWGMGDIFRGGYQNVLLTIDKEKISTQEFMKHFNRLSLNEDEIKNISQTTLLEEIISDFVGKKVVAYEIEKFGIQINDESLKNIIVNDKTFFKNNKFSRTEYEKFLLSSSMTAPMFEKNIVDQEKRRIFLSYLSDGFLIPEYFIEKEFKRENQIKTIRFIDLSEIYNKKIFDKIKMEEIYEENQDIFVKEYKSFNYIELTPKILIGKPDYNDEFYNKIEKIENDVLDEKSVSQISKEYNLSLNEINLLDEERTYLDGSKFKEIDKELFKKIFVNNLNTPIFINIENKFYLAEITQVDNKKQDLNNKDVNKLILNQLKMKHKIESNTNLAKEIATGEFNNLKMESYAKINNVQVKNKILSNLNDNEVFNKSMIRRIFETEDNQLNLITDRSFKKNFLIYVEKTEYKSFKKDSKNFEKYKNRAKMRFIREIYDTYDKSLNAKYNIKLNDKVINRIKNSF